MGPGGPWPPAISIMSIYYMYTELRSEIVVQLACNPGISTIGLGSPSIIYDFE